MVFNKGKIIRAVFLLLLILFSLILIDRIQPVNASVKEGFFDMYVLV